MAAISFSSAFVLQHATNTTNPFIIYGSKSKPARVVALDDLLVLKVAAQDEELGGSQGQQHHNGEHAVPQDTRVGRLCCWGWCRGIQHTQQHLMVSMKVAFRWERIS